MAGGRRWFRGGRAARLVGSGQPPGETGDRDVDGHGQQVRPVEAERERQHEPGQKRAGGRAERVDRVQEGPDAAQLVRAPHQVLAQERQRAAHQGRGR